MRTAFVAAVCFAFYTNTIFSQDTKRYIDSLYNFIETDTNTVYETAPELNSPYIFESLTHQAQLALSVFQPAGDTASLRPLIICLHSGSFLNGTKDNDDMTAFCRMFAGKGYVTSSIDYRLGVNFLSNTSAVRAVYRAIQDSRAAIRFFREFNNAYRIDTNKVYLLGSSAGAFMALHNIFLDKETERPSETFGITHTPPSLSDRPDLGGLDSAGNYRNHSGQANAIISLWGALEDTVLIEPGDEKAPVFLVHGTADKVVPFDVGPPFNNSLIASTYGSNPVYKRLVNLRFNPEKYFVSGAGHEFYGTSNGMWNSMPNAYWDTIAAKATSFLFNLHKPTAKFFSMNNFNTFIFTDKSLNAVKRLWNFGDGTFSEEQNPVHTYGAAGHYTVKLAVYSNVLSCDSAYSELTVDYIVPVELISFIGQASSNSVELKWQTASELNNKGFEVERLLSCSRAENLTAPNESWIIAGFVPGKGNSSGTTNYYFTDKNLIPGIYYYRLKQIDFNGTFKHSRAISVEVKNEIKTFSLYQNYPNPFNPLTVIRYQIPVRCSVSLKVYDLLGNEIAALAGGVKSPGNYEAEFNANNHTAGGLELTSGIYFYRLQAGDFIETKKFILLK